MCLYYCLLTPLLTDNIYNLRKNSIKKIQKLTKIIEKTKQKETKK